MGNFKINLDRKKLTKDYIESKQNFDSVLTKLKTTNPSTLANKGWIYGTIGTASVAAIIGVGMLMSAKNTTTEAVNNSQTNSNELVVSNTKPIEKEVVLAVNEMSYQPEQIVEKVVNVKVDEDKIAPQKQAQEKTTIENQVETSKSKLVEEKFIEVSTTVSASKNVAPSISGIFNGDLSFENFKTSEIVLTNDFKVKQFSLYYTSRAGDKSITVDGNKIPQNVLNEMESIGLNQRIYITNIVASNSTDNTIRCVSMDLNIKF
jgi:hypothetical protein